MSGEEPDLEAEHSGQQEAEAASNNQAAPGLVQKFLRRIGFAAKKNGADNHLPAPQEGKTPSHFDIIRAEIAKQRERHTPFEKRTPGDEQPAPPQPKGKKDAAPESSVDQKERTQPLDKTLDEEPRSVPPTLIDISEQMLLISSMQTVDISDPSELFETVQQDTPITVELDPAETQSLDESELVLLESSGVEEQAVEQPESPAPESSALNENSQPSTSIDPQEPVDDALAELERKMREIGSDLKDDPPFGEL